MAARFKWYCCRYMLRIICVDRSFSDTTTRVFQKCCDCSYKPERSGMVCEKRGCVNSRKAHGIPKTVVTEYA